MSPALERALLGRGAVMGTMLGCTVPLRFAGVEAEWGAAREQCGVAVADFRTLIAATGEDRVTFLQGMLSNDVAALAPGQGVYGAHLTRQGKIVADVRVYARADRLLLDVLTSRVDALTAALGRFIVADDVELVRVEDFAPLLSLAGPRSRATLERALATALPAWRELDHREVRYGSHSLLLISVSEAGGHGYLLCGASEQGASLFETLLAAGATPLGMDALNVLRLESGIPWYGIDMDENVLLTEAGLDRAVSFTKGCYLGQEVVERVAARGHVNRKLAGLLVDGADIPEPGALLRADEGDVGRITSAAWSPAVGRIIALGYVHRNCLEPGTSVSVHMGDRVVAATVTALPFSAQAASR